MKAATPRPGSGSDRVLGWDLLRGICALTVAFYHLSYWLGLTELPALGTYGVYLFFVLSGASLAYVYPADRFRSLGDAARFLGTRWLRVGPLYLLLCVVYVAMLSFANGALVDQLGLRFLLNATFGFGLYHPAITALLIGGWSLGVEFVYYLAFPLLARLLPMAGVRWTLLAVLVVLQFRWIEITVGSQGWPAAVVRYHQPVAFAAYFFGGCMLGHWQRQAPPGFPARMAWLAGGGWLAALVLLMPQRPGDELLGLRGAVLFAACLAAVHLSGRARLQGWGARLAAWGGDITYGTYLLHPILFFGLAWFIARPLTGAQPPQWPDPARWLTLVLVIVVATSLAALSERVFERPLRRWSRRRLQPAQSEAASISS